MKNEPFIVEKPLVIMFKQDDNIQCHIHPSEDMTYEMYGIAVCDLIKHISKAYRVSEDEIWKWVDIERNNPTSDITQVS